MRISAFAIVLLVAACTGQSHVEPTLDPRVAIWNATFEGDPTDIHYVLPDDHRWVFSFARMRLNSGPTGKRLQDRLAQGGEFLISGWPILNCSTEQVACLRAGPYVFAVPHQGRRLGLSYAAEGQQFEIVNCLDDGCTVLEVRAICESDRQGKCVIGGDVADKSVMSYFKFDSARGITAIEFGGGATGRPDQRSQLLGERGILAAPAT